MNEEATPNDDEIIVYREWHARMLRVEAAARDIVESADAHEMGLPSDVSIDALRAALDPTAAGEGR